MRMSDWSSDVCSSDLLEAEALHQRVFLVATETGQTVQRGAIVGPLAVVAEQLGLGNRRLRQFVMIIAAIRRRWERPYRLGLRQGRLRLRLCFRSVQHHALRPSVGNAVLRSSNARSEEHTSELQSLMRISYAVFCLKKK